MASEKPIVVVIGAGAAGLSAAVDLIGKAEVVVLEAKSRTGGRVWTCKFSDGGWADLGAAFIEGPGEKNPVTKLMKEFGVEVSPLLAESLEKGRIAQWGAFGAAGDMGVARKLGLCEQRKAFWAHRQLSQLYAKECEEMNQRFGKFTGPDDDNLWDGLRKLKGTGCMGFRGIDSLDDTTRAQVKYMWQVLSEHQLTDPIEQLSYRWFQEEHSHGGPKEQFGGLSPGMPIGGWQLMTDHLEKLARAGGVRIRLETVVVAIRQEGGRGVVIELASGEKIQCVACICTLPHGVLRWGNIVWEPVLPELKLDAINRLHSGCFNRVAIRFDKVFWATSPSIPCTGGRAQFHFSVPMEHGRHDPNSLSCCFFLDWEPISKSKIIILFYCAEVAERIEKMTDEQTLETSLKTLETHFGKKVREAKVEEYYFTRWRADPFALGTYACCPPGTSGEIREHMASPHGSVFFAGEATIKGLCATVAGALVSGRRAAGKVTTHLHS